MSKTDKRTEIIQAALELIAERGFHGVPMALIAGRAGVGAGTIYRYFASKEELIAELYRTLEGEMLPVVLHHYSTDQSIHDRFCQLGSALIRYFLAHPLHFRYLEQFYNSPFGVAKRRDKMLGKTERRDEFHELFKLGMAEKVLKDLPIPILSGLFFGPLLSVTRDHVLGFLQLDEPLIQAAIEACWDGIKR
jgi:AcrR family transcriptional regulator